MFLVSKNKEAGEVSSCFFFCAESVVFRDRPLDSRKGRISAPCSAFSWVTVS